MLPLVRSCRPIVVAQAKRISVTLHTSRRQLAAFIPFVIIALAFFCTARVAEGKICNIKEFLDECPTLDPVSSQIRNDFVIRREGVVVADIPCPSVSISHVPIAQYTDELIVLQALRTIYDLDKGRSGHLPWTPGTLYDWLKLGIQGINISATGPDQFVGNSFGDGRSYFNVRAKNDTTREWQRSWIGMAELIALIMHERRHADPGGYPHTSCCSVGANGCDQEYNEANLSPYGIQWWLRRQWIEGGLYTGYSCLSKAEVNDIKTFLRNTANQERARYCQNPPPLLTDANNPVGPCSVWCGRWPRIPLLVWRWLPVWVPVIVLLIGLVVWRVNKRAQTTGMTGSR